MKYFLVAFLFVTLRASAQYDTSSHRIVPLALSEEKWIDARSFFYDEDNMVYRPYASKYEVLGYLKERKFRLGGFPIYIVRDYYGGLDTVTILYSGMEITTKDTSVWQFKGCLDDSCLVKIKSGNLIKEN